MKSISKLISKLENHEVKYAVTQNKRYKNKLSSVSTEPIIKPPPLRGATTITEGKITDKDLARLQKLIKEKAPNKDSFISFLYEEYGINKKTHRISLRTGEIDRLSDG